jgi:glycosyltransferase involved in cell wall biosynthesis
MRRRKILFLAHSQSIHVKKWITYFVHKEWEVHVISFHPETIEGTTHYYLAVGEISADGNNFRYLKKLPRIIFLISRIRPDIINAHYLTSFGFLAYLTGMKKICITLQGSDVFLYSVRNILYRFLSKRILRKASYIFSVSDTMTRFICSRFKLNTSNITTLQYGIDTGLFRNSKPFPERSFTFITNRMFVHNSNYPLILQVMHRLKLDNINYSLLIIGSGPLKQQIDEMIDHYHLKDRITRMDAVDQSDLARFLNDAQIYISFTQSDGTPLSLFEAASCGLYPILSMNDANVEWINKGLKGTCVGLTDVPGIVTTIKCIMQTIHPSEYQTENSRFISTYMSYDYNMAIIEKKVASLI